MKTPCVYFLTNRPNGVLYIGVTSNLAQRVWLTEMTWWKGSPNDIGCTTWSGMRSMNPWKAPSVGRRRSRNGIGHGKMSWLRGRTRRGQICTMRSAELRFPFFHGNDGCKARERKGGHSSRERRGGHGLAGTKGGHRLTGTKGWPQAPLFQGTGEWAIRHRCSKAPGSGPSGTAVPRHQGVGHQASLFQSVRESPAKA